jgi:hypothetical protein
MGMTLMADDLNELFRAIGRLETAADQQAQTSAEIKAHLARQDEAAETNRGLAREAREADKRAITEHQDALHAQVIARIETGEEKMTTTYGLALANDKWIKDQGIPLAQWHHDEGSKLGGRVSLLEQARLADDAARAKAALANAGQQGEKRGRAWMIARVITLITLIGGILGWLGADRLSAILFSISVRLGHG